MHLFIWTQKWPQSTWLVSSGATGLFNCWSKLNSSGQTFLGWLESLTGFQGTSCLSLPGRKRWELLHLWGTFLVHCIPAGPPFLALETLFSLLLLIGCSPGHSTSLFLLVTLTTTTSNQRREKGYLAWGRSLTVRGTASGSSLFSSFLLKLISANWSHVVCCSL